MPSHNDPVHVAPIPTWLTSLILTLQVLPEEHDTPHIRNRQRGQPDEENSFAACIVCEETLTNLNFVAPTPCCETAVCVPCTALLDGQQSFRHLAPRGGDGFHCPSCRKTVPRDSAPLQATTWSLQSSSDQMKRLQEDACLTYPLTKTLTKAMERTTANRIAEDGFHEFMEDVVSKHVSEGLGHERRLWSLGVQGVRLGVYTVWDDELMRRREANPHWEYGGRFGAKVEMMSPEQVQVAKSAWCADDVRWMLSVMDDARSNWPGLQAKHSLEMVYRRMVYKHSMDIILRIGVWTERDRCDHCTFPPTHCPPADVPFTVCHRFFAMRFQIPEWRRMNDATSMQFREYEDYLQTRLTHYATRWHHPETADIHCILINLKRREDRLAEWTKEFQTVFKNYTVLHGRDASDVHEKDTQPTCGNKDATVANLVRLMTIGRRKRPSKLKDDAHAHKLLAQVCCFLSHYAAAKQAVELFDKASDEHFGSMSVMVMEDDTCIAPYKPGAVAGHGKKIGLAVDAAAFSPEGENVTRPIALGGVFAPTNLEECDSFFRGKTDHKIAESLHNAEGLTDPLCEGKPKWPPPPPPAPPPPPPPPHTHTWSHETNTYVEQRYWTMRW